MDTRSRHPLSTVAAIAVALIASSAFAQPATMSAPTSAPSTKPVAFIDQIEKFEADDAAQMPAPGGIVFYGSSTIRGWKTSEAFPDLPVINRGFGGSQMSHALLYDDRVVFKYQPKVVALYEGDNDMKSGKQPERIFGEIKTFAERLHAKVPTAKLVLISTKPSPSRWELQGKMTELNVMQKAYADANASWVTYFDGVPLLLGPDGQPRPELYKEDKLHLLPAGYAIWNDALRPVLTKLMKD